MFSSDVAATPEAQRARAATYFLATLDASRIMPDVIAIVTFPTSFSATARLSPSACALLDRLTPDQCAELELGRTYLYQVNHPQAPRGQTVQPLPADFRAKVAAYCEALMARKTGIPKNAP